MPTAYGLAVSNQGDDALRPEREMMRLPQIDRFQSGSRHAAKLELATFMAQMNLA